MTRLRPLIFIFPLLALSCASGEPLPPLFPVTGQVVKNGAPVKGGSLSFVRLHEQRPYVIVGQVTDAGAFEMYFIHERKKIPGVPEGEYHVTYSPPVLGKDAFPVTLPNPIEIGRETKGLRLDIGVRE
jgi:hypothetical protein